MSEAARRRFLLDENVPRAVTGALGERGHDVELLPDALRSAADTRVLAYAARQRRILTTLDTDFGGLVFVGRQRLPPAVVLLRVGAVALVARLAPIIEVMEQALAVSDVFVVIDGRGARVRPLPKR